MLVESLVIFSCSIGHCSESIDAYNHHYPQNFYVQAMDTKKKLEKRGERLAKEHVPPFIIHSVVPIAAWMIKQEAAFGVARDMTFRIKIDENYKRFNVGLAYSF